MSIGINGDRIAKRKVTMCTFLVLGGNESMEMFKLENVWICRLAYVHRKRPNDMMVMEEGIRNCILIMKEVDFTSLCFTSKN